MSNNEIIEIQGIKLSLKGIETIKDFQDGAGTDMIEYLNDITRYLIDVSVNVGDEEVVMSHLGILETVKKQIATLSLVKS